MIHLLEASNQTWRDVYKAAVFETDRSKTAKRIGEAERVIVTRSRCLNSQPNSMTERRALDAALYALHTTKKYLNTGNTPKRKPH